MAIFIIGVVSVVSLIWTLAWSLGTELNAEKRRQVASLPDSLLESAGVAQHTQA